jgi:hypothetical protein
MKETLYNPSDDTETTPWHGTAFTPPKPHTPLKRLSAEEIKAQCEAYYDIPQGRLEHTQGESIYAKTHATPPPLPKGDNLLTLLRSIATHNATMESMQGEMASQMHTALEALAMSQSQIAQSTAQTTAALQALIHTNQHALSTQSDALHTLNDTLMHASNHLTQSLAHLSDALTQGQSTHTQTLTDALKTLRPSQEERDDRFIANRLRERMAQALERTPSSSPTQEKINTTLQSINKTLTTTLTPFAKNQEFERTPTRTHPYDATQALSPQEARYRKDLELYAETEEMNQEEIEPESLLQTLKGTADTLAQDLSEAVGLMGVNMEGAKAMGDALFQPMGTASDAHGLRTMMESLDQTVKHGTTK